MGAVSFSLNRGTDMRFELGKRGGGSLGVVSFLGVAFFVWGEDSGVFWVSVFSPDMLPVICQIT